MMLLSTAVRSLSVDILVTIRRFFLAWLVVEAAVEDAAGSGAAEEHAERLAAADVDDWTGGWTPGRAPYDCALCGQQLEFLQRRH